MSQTPDDRSEVFLPEDKDQNERLSTGLNILSFLIPLAGIIIYFSNRGRYPRKAKMACTAALAGIGLGFLLNILAGMGRG